MQSANDIASLSIEDLLSIIIEADELDDFTIEQVRAELLSRGINQEQQDELIEAFELGEYHRLLVEERDRATEGYFPLELIWMALRWPFTLLKDWHLRKEGYLRMHQQRLYAIGLGIILWVVLGFYFDYEFKRSQRAEQNAINQVDIYEWELENYTKEEIAQSRKKAIEKVIALVKANEKEGIDTYVIMEGDTLDNDRIEDLRELDMLNVRDVVFQESIRANAYVWVEIRLVNPL